MRINMFYSALGLGGNERFMINLAKGIVEHGQQVKIFTYDYQCPLNSKVPVEMLRPSYGMMSFRAALSMRHCDIINPFGDPHILPTAMVKTFFRKKLIWYRFNPPAQWYLGNSTSNLGFYTGSGSLGDEARLKWVLSGVRNFMRLGPPDLILTNSEWVARLIEEDTGIVTKVLHPGVDPEVFKPNSRGDQIRERYGLGDAPLVFTVGRHGEFKAHDLLVRAMGIIHGIYPEVRCILAGWGEYSAHYRELIKSLGLEGVVLMPGIIPDNELPDYYNAADVVAFTAWAEHFGIVPLEAMACEKPVVAQNMGGPKEVISDGIEGLLFRENNYQDLAMKIIALLDDEDLRHSMGRRGREKILSRFTWDHTTKGFLKFCESIL